MTRRQGGTHDPIALRSPARVRFFLWIMQRQMRRAFHGVRVNGPRPAPPAERPLVVYTNHPSWWDPAFGAVLHGHFFAAREAYGVIDAAMLERYRFMRRIGLFGVERGTREGGATFLRTGGRILERPGTALYLTPEGRFTDLRTRPVRFMSGLHHLLARHPQAVALPVAFEYPFWTERFPEALARFGQPIERPEPGELEHRLEETMDTLAADVIARDPARFEEILSGSAGVGGVYDLSRRLRAWSRGRGFDPEHGRG